MRSININELSDKLVPSNLIHQKRERAVYKSGNEYYKIWVRAWEHSKAVRHALNIGFYDEALTSGLTALIVDDDLDVGYAMKAGKLIGKSSDNWQVLIKNTTGQQRFDFIQTVFNRAVKHKCILDDMAPSNVILLDGNISLIDLESVQSYSWLFNGKPEEWEAQNRNLNKIPHPYWRDVSKYLLSYLKECVGLTYKHDIDNASHVENIAHALNEKKSIIV
jgi:hypothetical protein